MSTALLSDAPPPTADRVLRTQFSGGLRGLQHFLFWAAVYFCTGLALLIFVVLSYLGGQVILWFLILLFQNSHGYFGNIVFWVHIFRIFKAGFNGKIKNLKSPLKNLTKLLLDITLKEIMHLHNMGYFHLGPGITILLMTLYTFCHFVPIVLFLKHIPWHLM